LPWEHGRADIIKILLKDYNDPQVLVNEPVSGVGAVSAVSSALPVTIRIAQATYELKAVDQQARDLLDTTAHADTCLGNVRMLCRQKSTCRQSTTSTGKYVRGDYAAQRREKKIHRLSNKPDSCQAPAVVLLHGICLP
jgi:hypothetical protein